MTGEKFVCYKDKTIGKLLYGRFGTKLYVKNVDKKKHLFRKYRAYGIQKEIFDKFLKDGVTKILIKEDTGRRYLSDIDAWKMYGIVEDYGDGEQIFLCVDYMEDRTNFKLFN